MAFSSCKGDILDGLPSLTWRLDGEEACHQFNVDSAQESTYRLVCTTPNFSKVAIVECEVDGVSLHPTEDNPQIIDGDWFTIDLDGKEVTVSFKSNETGQERVLYIQMAARDPSFAQNPSQLYFTQAAQEEAESEEAGE